MPCEHIEAYDQVLKEMPIPLGQLPHPIISKQIMFQVKTHQLGPDPTGYVSYSLCIQLIV